MIDPIQFLPTASFVLGLIMVAGVADTGDRIALAGLPCSELLAAYDTKRGEDWFSSIANDVNEMDTAGVLGNVINHGDYVLTECRLNEGFTVRQAVSALFSAVNSQHLPPIPSAHIATPEEEAEAQEYKRWLKHQGPKPRYFRDWSHARMPK